MGIRTDNVDKLIAGSTAQIEAWTTERDPLLEILGLGRTLTAAQRIRFDELRALIATEKATVAELTERREVAARSDKAESDAAASKQILTLAASAVAISDKATATVDAEVDATANAFVAALAKRAKIRASTTQPAKDSVFALSGLGVQGDRVRAAQTDVDTKLKADERHKAATDLAYERHQFNMMLTDFQQLLAPIVTDSAVKSPAASAALQEVIARAWDAFSGDTPAAAQRTFVQAGRRASEVLKANLFNVKAAIPNAKDVQILPDEFGQLVAVRDGKRL